MRVALALVLAAVAAPPKTSLKITYWPHGRTGPATMWTLGCAPAVGSHPLRGRACLQLKAHTVDLDPATKACNITAIAGSPQALIRGVYNGKAVDRGFRIGCPGWSDLRLVLTGS